MGQAEEYDSKNNNDGKQQEKNNPYSAGGSNQRDRRQKPKQEPLAYAYRTQASSKGNGYNNKQESSSLGSGYALVQMHPPPPPPPPKQQYLAPQTNNRPMGNQYKSMGRQPKPQPSRYMMNNGSRKQHNASGNMSRPPFGMPAMRTPPRPSHNMHRPSRHHQQQQVHTRKQQMYQMASSPALTYDQVMMMQYLQNHPDLVG